MPEYDPDISNGTCYYKDGGRLPARYIPCGNGALGHKACCESLDMCLSSRACYNGQYGVTYLAGCTDPNYQDANCPDKHPFQDQSWAGLVLCHPTYNDDSNEWIACEDEGISVSSPAPCTCPSTSRNVAFTDFTALNNIMSLPASHGGTVTWKDSAAYSSAHPSASTPSDISGSSTTGTSTSKSVVFTSSSSPYATSTGTTLSQDPPSTQQSGPGKGAIIGIAVGVFAVVIVMIIIGYLCWKCLLRRREAKQGSLTSSAGGRPQSIEPEMKSPASELPADESTAISPRSAYQPSSRIDSAEVEGDSIFTRTPTRLTMGGDLQRPNQRSACYELPA